MSLQVSGQVQKGVLPNVASGTSSQPLTQGAFGEVLVSELNGRYANLTLAGQVFSGFFASGAVAAASATATGPFALFNPNNSGKNLVLLKVMAQVATFTAGTTGAGFGFQFVANQQPTATTPGNAASNALVGSGVVSIAKLFTAGTLVGAPTIPGVLFGGAYLDLAAGDAISIDNELAGSIVIQPGSGVCIVSSGTLTANLVASVTWAELPQ